MHRNKYGNRKVQIDGRVFDSKREASRYCELKMLEKCHKIKDLQMQVPFELVPPIYEKTGEFFKKGVKAGQPKLKLVERGVKYVADFVYFDVSAERWIAEDSKGMRTKEYIVKRKLFKWRYPAYIFREV